MIYYFISKMAALS